MARLVIAPSVHPGYLDGPLHDCSSARYVMALVVLAHVTSDDDDQLRCPPAGRVRELASMSRRKANDVRGRLTAAGALHRQPRGGLVTVHAPGYLHRNELGRGLAAYGLSGLIGLPRESQALRPVMLAILRVTPYGLASVTIPLSELARSAGYSPRWTRRTLDQLADQGWLEWTTEPAGLVTVTLDSSAGALTLLAYPFDLPAGMQWASRP